MLKNSVSVIIPNFNYSQWIKRCVESCVAQGPLLNEVIIVDDHSTDNSIDMIREMVIQYPDKVKLFINPQKGGNHARNFGFEQSSGAFIQWLDADDYLLPGKFAAQVAELEKGEADIVYSNWRMDHYENGDLVKAEDIHYGPFDDFMYELIKDNWTVPCNYLLKRKVAAELAGGFGWNPETKVTQDREYFTKAAILGAKFTYVQGCFSVYNRWGDHTVSGMKYTKRLEHCYRLNLQYQKLINESEHIADKKKYIRVLNSQVISTFFHNPAVKLFKIPMPWDISFKNLHWKLRAFLPVIYLKIMSKKYFRL
jgi:glycosyltransferase involved in cell wall biosynthesis